MQHTPWVHNSQVQPQKISLRRHRTGGYTLLDMLVALAVLSVLIAIMLPTVGKAMYKARMVVAQSNLRQIGYAMEIWSQDHNGMLPGSIFTETRTNLTYLPKHMQVLYNQDEFREGWDGLGKLIEEGYVTAEVFYAPAHEGEHPFERYQQDFNTIQAGGTPSGPIHSNFFYRWLYEDERLSAYIPSSMTLVSDGIRTKSDFNHRTGAYAMRIDASVAWQADSNEYIYKQLPNSLTDYSQDFIRGLDTPTNRWDNIVFALDRGVEEAILWGRDIPKLFPEFDDPPLP